MKRTIIIHAVAHVAQSVEHILGKDEVTGSIPVMGFVSQQGNLNRFLVMKYIHGNINRQLKVRRRNGKG